MSKEKISRDEALGLISKSSIYGNLGLFIGAGMSMAILNDDWNEVALSWKQLIYKCAEEFDINLKEEIKTEGISYPEIASEIAKLISIKESIDYNIGVKKLKEKISTLTSWYPEKEQREIYGKIIQDIDPDWIITTNYDLILECLLTGKCLSLGPNDQLISPQNLIPVYHLHGIRTNPNSIIISQEDYISLFRPNQYRQQKLSLSIKESTTLIIGYGLGDVNVLTAVDWTKNVYSNQRINYPHEIIQLLYTESPKKDPYRDQNDILIIEFKDLKVILSEIAELVIKDKEVDLENEKKLHELNGIFQNPTEENVKGFIDDEALRKSIIDAISKNDIKLISGFLELFSKAIDETWLRAQPKGAFNAYNENLIILLDILENIELAKLPPALLESIAYNLDHVAYYVGRSMGESRAAYNTWEKRKENIPTDTKTELENIARARNYYRLKSLWKK
ncbi:MAG: SIR2 family protein [Bacteroidetes bacterium]|nr:MAG: SIR2 family protein [Bacteroidota bacterium]